MRGLTERQFELLERAAGALDGRVVDFRHARSIQVLVRRGLLTTIDHRVLGRPPREGRITASGRLTVDVPLATLAVFLEMAGKHADQDVCAKWTSRQRIQAADWAGAVHLRASDNQVRVPPMPDFLEDLADVE